jgi:hypothetical protein
MGELTFDPNSFVPLSGAQQQAQQARPAQAPVAPQGKPQLVASHPVTNYAQPTSYDPNSFQPTNGDAAGAGLSQQDGYQVVTPMPGESFADTMARARQRQASLNPQQAEQEKYASEGIVRGAGKSAAQTLTAVPRAIQRHTGISGGKQAADQADAALKPQGDREQLGATGETLLEFAMGDGALKGLSTSAKLAEAGKAMQFFEQYPRLARIVEAGIKGGVVGGAVGGIHDGVDGAVTGAEYGAAFGAGGQALGEGYGAVKKLYNTADPMSELNQVRNRSLIHNTVDIANMDESQIDNMVASGQHPQTTVPDTFKATLESKIPVRSAFDSLTESVANDAKVRYQAVDKAAGEALGQSSFDLKAERRQLATDKSKLLQLGNTDADVTQRGNLIEAINDSTDRIAKVEEALKAKGIDLEGADAQWQKARALEEVGKIFKNQNIVVGDVTAGMRQPEAINVDKLIIQLQKLGDSTKYVPGKGRLIEGSTGVTNRLEQALGTEGAHYLMDSLRTAQANGVHALKYTTLINSILKWSGIGAAAIGVGRPVYHRLTE